MDHSQSNDGRDNSPEKDETIHLRQFLAGRDVKCPDCACNLRDLKSDECPECGTRLLLQVGTVPRVALSWTVGLAGLSAAVTVPITVIVVAFLIGGFRTSDTHLVLGGHLVAIVAILALIVLWARKHEAFHGLRPNTQTMLAVACLASYPMIIVLYYVVLRLLR